MSPTVATITVLGVKLAVKALTYGLARRFRRASPDERVEILGEAWPQLVEPVDPATPLPPVDDVPLCVLNRVADLAANPDPDFLSEPPSASGSAGSVC